MKFEIVIHELATVEIEELRAYDQRVVVDAIEEQLTFQPMVPTRRRKCLFALEASFEHEQPIWELRVKRFRVFYDIDEPSRIVNVRAVRRKDASHRTEDIV